MHQLVEESSHVLVVADDPEGLVRACRNAGGAREQYEILPDFEKHMIRQRDVDVRGLDLLYVTGEFITTGIAFTSRSVVALQEKDLANRRPPMPSLITTLGGTIAAVCSRCQSRRNLRIRHGQAMPAVGWH